MRALMRCGTFLSAELSTLFLQMLFDYDFKVVTPRFSFSSLVLCETFFDPHEFKFCLPQLLSPAKDP